MFPGQVVLWDRHSTPQLLGPTDLCCDFAKITDKGTIAAVNGTSEALCFWNARDPDPASTRRCYPGPIPGEEDNRLRDLADTPGGGALAIAYTTKPDGTYFSYTMDCFGNINVLPNPEDAAQAFAEGINGSSTIVGISTAVDFSDGKAIVWKRHGGPWGLPRSRWLRALWDWAYAISPHRVPACW